MQPLSGPKSGSGESHRLDTSMDDSRNQPQHRYEPALTSAQRTALERVIVRIMAISNLKAAELWAGVRHHVGVRNDAELLSGHFPLAENWLKKRLRREENNHAVRRALQQLSDLLPRGNNRQAVSDYIRQHFGQTVLSALTHQQLQQVLSMLQQGQIDIPHPVQHRTTDRSLLPAEHQALNQQVIKLSVASGESPQGINATLYSLLGLKNGDPIPSRYYALISQYLQARLLILQPDSITLHSFLHGLKQPVSLTELTQINDYMQQRYALDTYQELTAIQAQDLLNRLFKSRAGDQVALTTNEEKTSIVKEAKLIRPHSQVNHKSFNSKIYLWSAAIIMLLLLLVWLK